MLATPEEMIQGELSIVKNDILRDIIEKTSKNKSYLLLIWLLITVCSSITLFCIIAAIKLGISL